MIALAVSNNNIDLAKLLHDRGCEFSSTTMVWAVFGGNLDIVKWLHSNGCIVTVDAMVDSKRYRKYDIYEWFVSIIDTFGFSSKETDFVKKN
jgi:hypothetical protein